jgi:hypothetical protein
LSERGQRAVNVCDLTPQILMWFSCDFTWCTWFYMILHDFTCDFTWCTLVDFDVDVCRFGMRRFSKSSFLTRPSTSKAFLFQRAFRCICSDLYLVIHDISYIIEVSHTDTEVWDSFVLGKKGDRFLRWWFPWLLPKISASNGGVSRVWNMAFTSSAYQGGVGAGCVQK